jgi:hypothetical protein
MKLLVMLSSPLPCYLVLLRPKYLPQYRILEDPQPTFLTQCEKPSFTRTKYNRQNYVCAHFNIQSLCFWIGEGKAKYFELNIS